MSKILELTSCGYNTRLKVAFQPGKEDDCCLMGGSNVNVTVRQIIEAPDTVFCSREEMEKEAEKLYEARRRKVLGLACE